MTQENIIAPGRNLRDAIERLSRVQMKILAVEDSSGRLAGIVTDFDIRKALVDSIPFDAPVESFMQRNPVTAPEQISRSGQMEILENRAINYLPLVNRDGIVTNIASFRDIQVATTPRRRKAVIMAGGFGKRLHPLTADTPKPLLSVGGRPILFYLIDHLLAEGFGRIVVTTHFKHEKIIEALGNVERFRDKIEFVIEDEPLGTAGSLSLVPHLAEEPFLVLNADLLTDIPFNIMFDFHQGRDFAATMAVKRHQTHIPYGVIETNGDVIRSIKEKPVIEKLINLGAYILHPGALNHLDKGQYCDMPTLMDRVMESGQNIGCFPVHEDWLDIGDHKEYQRAQTLGEELVRKYEDE